MSDTGPYARYPSLNGRSVFITGVTGVLGGKLLHDLLSDTDVRVTCLVRGKTVDAGSVAILADAPEEASGGRDPGAARTVDLEAVGARLGAIGPEVRRGRCDPPSDEVAGSLD